MYDGFIPVLDSSLLCFCLRPGDGGYVLNRRLFAGKEGRRPVCLETIRISVSVPRA